MSSSSKSAPEPAQASEVQPFPYSELPIARAADAAGPLASASISPGADQPLAHPDEVEVKVKAQDLDASVEAERQLGEAQARAGFELRLEEIRESVRAALADFGRERARYFQQVEAEIVQLALSISRKILRREAQID